MYGVELNDCINSFVVSFVIVDVVSGKLNVSFKLVLFRLICHSVVQRLN